MLKAPTFGAMFLHIDVEGELSDRIDPDEIEL
jgi:hypothetical protein